MRLALNNVSMDGVVVIGEGEKDEAPMLYNGEQIGDGSPPQVDIAVDPLEGTELTAMGFPNALSVIALSERGTMFNPGPGGLHGEDGHLAVTRARARHGPAARRDRQGDREGEGHRRRRRDGDHARPPPPRGAGQGDPRGRRAHPLHPPRRRLGLDPRRSGGLAGGPPVGNRRHPRGRHLGVRDQVPRRPDPRPPVAAQRRGAAGDHRRRPRPRRGARPRPTSSPARTRSSRPRA